MKYYGLEKAYYIFLLLLKYKNSNVENKRTNKKLILEETPSVKVALTSKHI